MGDAIDTGPGGFDVAGQTYVYDVGVPEADGGAQGPHKPAFDVSAGYVDPTGAPKDLSKKTKTTLAQYLSDQTTGKGTATGVPNRYPVDAGYVELASTSKAGNPSLQTPGSNKPANTKSFAPAGAPASLSDAFANLIGLKKGKADATGVDGNDLLPGVPGNSTFVSADGTSVGDGPAVPAGPMNGHPDTSAVVGPFISAVLRGNRFSSAANSFASATAQPGAAGFSPLLVQQDRLGVFDPRAPAVSIDSLATIGPLLTMRAGKELMSAQPRVDPASDDMQANARLPGVAQLGVTQVDAALLYASDVLANMTDDPLDRSTILDVSSRSWGALNNTEDPFSGTDAIGMVALSLALVAGLELLVEGLSALLGLVASQTRRPTHDAQGRYGLGEYYASDKQARRQASGGIAGTVGAIGSLNFGALLGIQPTNYPFGRALSTGSRAFFGLPTDGGLVQGLFRADSSSIDSPGFNVVVARSILRSGIVIAERAKKVGGSPINAAMQVLALLDVIRSSKLVGACNVFAALGDAILSLPEAWIDKDALGGVKVSHADSLDNALSNGANKNRMKGSLKTAWASNRAPANLLLPSSILSPSAHVTGLGQYDAMLGTRSDPLSRVSSTVVSDAGTNRIDSASAAAFEASLDAEYVPFYFHDVRTNEMIAFHAFLTSLTDDFTAAYERSEGYGRVEPVKTYKGTERRIGLSFYVAATSQPDFDEMWVKINKLVTLVYPQFTKGVQLSSGDGSSYRFTQPFSQLIGASPLVRLRLGDLLKSNYSRFGLARLFGLGNSELTVNGQKVDKPTVDAGVFDRYSSALRLALGNPQGETYYVSPGSYPFVDTSTLGTKLPGVPVPPLGNSDGPRFAPQFSPHAAPGGTLIVKARAADTPSAKSASGGTQLVCEVMVNDDPAFQASYSRALAAVVAEYGSPLRPLQNVIGGTYVVPTAALTATSKTKRQLLQKVAPAPVGSFATELGSFLAPGGSSPNAVAKAFNDTGGKGLAGFIESMAFDWYDKALWETSPDRTAPMMCKVTLAFSPIHDITPGLDHLGFNRGPVYPVGLLAQQFDPTRGGSA